jgi:hypothetical protein
MDSKTYLLVSQHHSQFEEKLKKGGRAKLNQGNRSEADVLGLRLEAQTHFSKVEFHTVAYPRWLLELFLKKSLDVRGRYIAEQTKKGVDFIEHNMLFIDADLKPYTLDGAKTSVQRVWEKEFKPSLPPELQFWGGFHGKRKLRDTLSTNYKESVNATDRLAHYHNPYSDHKSAKTVKDFYDVRNAEDFAVKELKSFMGGQMLKHIEYKIFNQEWYIYNQDFIQEFFGPIPECFKTK